MCFKKRTSHGASAVSSELGQSLNILFNLMSDQVGHSEPSLALIDKERSLICNLDLGQNYLLFVFNDRHCGLCLCHSCFKTSQENSENRAFFHFVDSILPSSFLDIGEDYWLRLSLKFCVEGIQISLCDSEKNNFKPAMIPKLNEMYTSLRMK